MGSSVRTGFEFVSGPATFGGPGNLAGLAKDSSVSSITDGSEGSVWYWSVGARQAHEGGIPGPRKSSTDKYVLSKVELYAVKFEEA